LRGSAALILLVSLGATVGCVAMRPLDEVRQTVDRAGVGRLLDVGGQRVYSEIAGQGEPVILLHGFGASSYSWRKVVPELARDYRVVALDLNGFGLSDRPADPSSYTREGQVSLVLRTLDTLGIDSAHFVGHSYGGALTMALVAEYPERVRSMVLVDSAAPEYPIKRRKWLLAAPPVTWTWVRGLALRKSFVRRAFRHAYHNDDIVTDELVEAYRDRLRVQGTVKAYRKMTRPRREPPDVEVEYGELGVPALVVWGAEDKLVTAAKGRAHAERLPDYRFVTIDGSGHSPMEEKPAEFLAAVRPFLQEVAGRN
jgi:pimeloyl-ACP methyl ester carboxylesterase